MTQTQDEPERKYRETSFISDLTYSWMNDIFKLGNKRPLEDDDLLEIQQEDEMKHLTEELCEMWSDELLHRTSAGKAPRLWRCVLVAFPTQTLIVLTILVFVVAICSVLLPALLAMLIFMLTHQSNFEIWQLWTCAVALPVVAFVKGLIIHFTNFVSDRLGMQIRSALMGLVFHKILQTGKGSIQKFESGHVIDLVSNDVQRLESLALFLLRIIAAPSIVIATAVLIWYVIDATALAGYFLFVLKIPYMVMAYRLTSKYRQGTGKASDKRIGMITECVAGIWSVKSHALEPNYERKISVVRSEEMKNILYKNLVKGGIQVLFSTFSITFAFMCVMGLFIAGKPLTPTGVFLIMSISGVLRYEYFFLTQYALLGLAEAAKSLQRIQEFLELPCLFTNEIEDTCETFEEKLSSSKDGDILISCASSKAIDSDNFLLLRDIDVHIPAGSLTVLTGSVGSGKSSLLRAIIGELPLSSGEISCSGKVAFVPQQPWVFSGTIQENILFHLPWNKKWYGEVIRACQLETDLASLPDGDQTIVGEKGAVLSGGQQARVSLARAVYANADIYLLDSPLSAVDVKVGKSMFDECINGLLVEKTRVLVTHGDSFIQQADKVVVLEGGSVKAAARTGEEAEQVISDEANNDKTLDFKTVKKPDQSEPTADAFGAAGLEISDEDKMVGHVSLLVYWKYFVAGLHWIFFFVTTFLFLISQVALTGADVALSFLSKSKNKQQSWSDGMPLYVALLGASIIFSFLTVVLFLLMTYKSSLALHNSMVFTILRAPVLFFDTTPVGRITNRFSKDIGCVDELLPFPFILTVQLVLSQLTAVIVPSVSNYRLLGGTVPLLIIFCWLCGYYLRTSRELKRLESICRSPVFSHFSETMEGLETIRTNHKEQVFIDRLYSLQDKQTRAFVMTLGGERWLSVRTEVISAALIAIVSVGALLIRQNPVLAGLALTYVTTTGVLSQKIVRQFGLVENCMTSVERVMTYTEINQEPGYMINKNPPDNWPTSGHIVMDDVTLRYYDGGPAILQGLTCQIQAKTKVGIAGRTGAGKSSLVATLMRMPQAEGSIIIDGIDISTLNIQESRKCISVLAQTPVLFQGTLRENLDPFDEFEDHALWAVLSKVQLHDLVRGLDNKLHYELLEQGSNFSLGERQLLCLARTLLRKNKILILDEPTAHVDPKTEETMQNALWSELQNCTVITIAHRLHTLTECDTVIVMEGGKIIQTGTASEVLCADPQYLIT